MTTDLRDTLLCGPRGGSAFRKSPVTESSVLSPQVRLHDFLAQAEKWQARILSSQPREQGSMRLFLGLMENQQPQGWQFRRGRREDELKDSLYEMGAITVHARERHVSEYDLHPTGRDRFVMQCGLLPTSYGVEERESSQFGSWNTIQIGLQLPTDEAALADNDSFFELILNSSLENGLQEALHEIEGVQQEPEEEWEQTSLRSPESSTLTVDQDLQNALAELASVPEDAAEADFTLPTREVQVMAEKVLRRLYRISPRPYHVYVMPYGDISINAATPWRTALTITCDVDGTARCLVYDQGNMEQRDYEDPAMIPDDWIRRNLARWEV